ncbi:MAG: formylmethanofuran dehydrogenase subunit E family protein [Candidatus Omnitrophota bacterium]
MKRNVDLKKAVDFHGHLGPYLVLGMLMGDLAVRKLRCKRYFGIEVMVRGVAAKPMSCLIDGIQISTGCTYGKGNIHKFSGEKITALFRNVNNNKKVGIALNSALIQRLNSLTSHKESELFARKIFKENTGNLFEIRIY